MSKDKRKGAHKNKTSADLLDSATAGLRKFRRFAKQYQKLSTTQKVVGGLALLAAGYALATRSSPDEATSEASIADEPVNAAPDLPPGSDAPAKAPKPRRPKPSKPAHHHPFSEERP